MVLVRSLDLKEWPVSVTKELRGDAFARHVEETVGDKNIQLIYRGMVIDGEKTLEEHGITHRVLVRLVSQNLTGVECPRSLWCFDAGTAVSCSAAVTAPAPRWRTLSRYKSDPVYVEARSDEVQRELQETWWKSLGKRKTFVTFSVCEQWIKKHGHLYGLAAVND